MFRRRRSLPVLDPRYTTLMDPRPRFPYPSAAAYRAIRNGSSNFASQIDAAKALHNRLHGDGVTHAHMASVERWTDFARRLPRFTTHNNVARNDTTEGRREIYERLGRLRGDDAA